MSKKEYTSIEIANEILKKALEVYKNNIKKSETVEEATEKKKQELIDS